VSVRYPSAAALHSPINNAASRNAEASNAPPAGSPPPTPGTQAADVLTLA